MTNKEREKIRELRTNGMGYKAIASALGLTRDSVRSFCKRNELTGNSCVVALNIKEKKKRNLLCNQCGKPIKQESRGRDRKFCSDECRRTWWNENQDKRNKSKEAIYKYICNYCNKEFSVYGNKNRKYCSHNCYIKDRFWREEENEI